jgi:hypothetical protein
MGWGAVFLDVDLDGKQDLFFANGHIFADIEAYPPLGETYRQKNQLLLNLGARFRDLSERAGGGLQVARVGRGLIRCTTNACAIRATKRSEFEAQ